MTTNIFLLFFELFQSYINVKMFVLLILLFFFFVLCNYSTKILRIFLRCAKKQISFNENRRPSDKIVDLFCPYNKVMRLTSAVVGFCLLLQNKNRICHFILMN